VQAETFGADAARAQNAPPIGAFVEQMKGTGRFRFQRSE
jgi:hypothetical protein